MKRKNIAEKPNEEGVLKKQKKDAEVSRYKFYCNIISTNS
jgi:hypothetical protein